MPYPAWTARAEIYDSWGCPSLCGSGVSAFRFIHLLIAIFFLSGPLYVFYRGDRYGDFLKRPGNHSVAGWRFIFNPWLFQPIMHGLAQKWAVDFSRIWNLEFGASCYGRRSASATSCGSPITQSLGALFPSKPGVQISRPGSRSSSVLIGLPQNLGRSRLI